MPRPLYQHDLFSLSPVSKVEAERVGQMHVTFSTKSCHADSADLTRQVRLLCDSVSGVRASSSTVWTHGQRLSSNRSLLGPSMRSENAHNEVPKRCPTYWAHQENASPSLSTS